MSQGTLSRIHPFQVFPYQPLMRDSCPSEEFQSLGVVLPSISQGAQTLPWAALSELWVGLRMFCLNVLQMWVGRQGTASPAVRGGDRDEGCDREMWLEMRFSRGLIMALLNA